MFQPFRQLELLSRSLANSDHSSGVLVRRILDSLKEHFDLGNVQPIDRKAHYSRVMPRGSLAE